MINCRGDIADIDKGYKAKESETVFEEGREEGFVVGCGVGSH